MTKAKDVYIFVNLFQNKLKKCYIALNFLCTIKDKRDIITKCDECFFKGEMALGKKIFKRALYIIICIVIWLGVTSVPTGYYRGMHNKTSIPDFPVFNPVESLYNDYKQSDVVGMSFEASITELSELLEAGAFTAEELVEYYLERIEEYNSEFNCFITLCDDALEVARLRDEQRASGEILGKLHGIPIVVKDNIDVEGYPTTNGERWRKNNIAADNANVVQKLVDAGAIIIGKTNMSTAAQYASHSVSDVQGETKNAYSLSHASGGSSGGTAVSVSLNFAAAGLGTDTNSSLRIPAAYSATVSLRPTYGLIDTDGVIPLNYNRDVVGTITKTVEDQALMLDVMTDNEYSFYDDLDADYLEGARIGYLVQLCEPDYNVPFNRSAVDQEVIDAVKRAAEEMEAAGATVIRVEMPNLFYYNSTRSYDAMHADLKNLFKQYDLDGIIFPACLSKTPSSGFDSSGVPIAQTQDFINPVRYFSSTLGVPEITVPIGYTEDGLSIGLEIVGLKGDDKTLVNLAYSYEQSTLHRTPSSLAPNLYEYDSDDIEDYMFILNKKKFM